MHGARGRIGNVVGYQREGEKLMRALPTSVKNPQTDEQTITRLALSSAAKTAQHLRSIVDHSFQGVKYGQKSVNYFTSTLAKEIREFMKSAMAAGSSVAPFGTAPVLPYSAGAVAAGAKALIAKGDLAACPFRFSTGIDGAILIGPENSLSFVEADLEQVTVANFETVFGVPMTDQLTFVVAVPVELDYVSETELFYGVRFAYRRVNFLQGLAADTKIFSNFGTSQSIKNFNSAVIDTSRSSADVLSFKFEAVANDLAIYEFAPELLGEADNFVLAGVITSRYENGAWRRSTTRLIQNPFANPQTAAAYESSYGYNDIASVLALAAPKKAGVEDRYLNKEKN